MRLARARRPGQLSGSAPAWQAQARYKRALPLVFSALLGCASDEKHATVRLLGRRPRPHPGGRPAAVRSPLRAPAALETGTPGSAAVVEGHLVAVGVGEREGAAERPVEGR